MTIIYVATTVLGVFYTDDYVDETVQPIWEDVSAGLPALDCKEFHVDPTDPLDRQYVLLTNSNEANTLHRRVNGGAWEEILNCTEAAAICGCDDTDSVIGGFCLNSTIPGKIWVTFGSNGLVEEPDGYWTLYSDDYGDTWNLGCDMGGGIFTYGLGVIVAHDDYVFASCSTGAGGGPKVYYSIDGGVNWNFTGGGPPFMAMSHNILTPDSVYYYDAPGLQQFTIGGAVVSLGGPTHLRGDAMWFDPVDPDTQRLFDYFGYRLNYTTDNWTNYSATNTNLDPYAFNPIDINGEIICAIKLDHAAHQHHCIAVLTDVTDVNPVGIAGTNCDTAPFTDSIPDTCGGVCLYGIQAFEPAARDAPGNYHERNHWVGTAAEMALCTPVNPGAVWFQTDTGDSYWWDGASWNAMGGGGGGGCFVCDVTNTYGGDGALVSHTTATNDTAVGYNALNAELGGGCNVAVGSEALEFNTSGDANIAVGYLALVNNTTGYANIAIGSPRPTWDATLGSLTTARGCIAIGSECLTLVTERDNIGIGLGALYQAGDTYNNIGIGTDALWSLIRGIDDKQGDNIAIGSCALFELIYGGENVGIGENFSFYYGEYNVFVGHRAGDSTSNASDNIGVGAYACQGIAGAGEENTAIGSYALMLSSAEINSIDEFSDYSATVPGTVLAHNIDPWGFGLANGVYPDMRITGTDHYNGNYTITVIDSKHFYFTHAWNGDDIAAGYWMAEVDYALYANGNTACGYGAGWSNYDGSYNTYLGYLTDYDSAAVNLTNSMALGANAGFTKSNQVVIGDDNIDETLLKGTVIINEIGDASWDFRVESDTYDAIFVDASNDSVELMSNAAGKVGFFGVAAAVQSTGWAMSNVTPDKILDANATTLDEVADVLGTLIDQLKLHGILGA